MNQIKNIFDIVYIFDKGFLPQTATSIVSACENSENGCLKFHLIIRNVNKNNQNLLEQLIKKYKNTCMFYEIGKMSKYFSFKTDTSGWNNIVLIRLVLSQILPKDIKRILYVDGDTIFVSDVTPLMTIDLQDNVVGMVIEPTVDKKQKEQLGLKNYCYHNAGVILIDMDKWRKFDCEKRILDYLKAHDGKLFANDQDAINAILKDQIFHLPPKYNYCNTYDFYNYRYIKKLMDENFYYNKDEYINSINNPVVIHFLGEERPWRKGNTHRYKNDYVKYNKLTPFSDEGFEDGWQTYFLFWRIFNLFSKPFPAMRYKIINGLIPIVMKIRSKKLKND